MIVQLFRQKGFDRSAGLPLNASRGINSPIWPFAVAPYFCLFSLHFQRQNLRELRDGNFAIDNFAPSVGP